MKSKDLKIEGYNGLHQVSNAGKDKRLRGGTESKAGRKQKFDINFCKASVKTRKISGIFNRLIFNYIQVELCCRFELHRKSIEYRFQNKCLCVKMLQNFWHGICRYIVMLLDGRKTAAAKDIFTAFPDILSVFLGVSGGAFCYKRLINRSI